MSDRQVTSPKAVLVVVLIVLATAAAVIIAVGLRPPGKQSCCVLDIKSLKAVDPSLVGYRQAGGFDPAIAQPDCIAIGPDDAIYVGGEKAIAVFAASPLRGGTIPTTGPVRAIAVAGDGTIYAAMTDHVEVFAPDSVPGNVSGMETRPAGPVRWPAPYDQAVLTAIAVNGGDVVVAEYSRKVVLHYDTDGKLLATLGRRNKDDSDSGFVVPSPYFDLAFAPDGLLRIANPGRLRIEAWTLDGDREFYWGGGPTTPTGPGGQPDPAGFVGCCNPAHIAIFADGRIVTSEKGIARIKVFKADRGFGRNGVLDCVVAGPDAFKDQSSPADIAVNSSGEVIALDPNSGRVKIFAPKSKDQAK